MTDVTNVIDSVKPHDVRGEMEEVTLVSNGYTELKKLYFENISFTNTENAKIKIISSKEERVEARYPKAMEDYGFSIEIDKGKIIVRVPEQTTNFIVDEFEIIIYSNIEKIKIFGSVSLEMDAASAKNISLDVEGAADINVSNLDVTNAEIKVSGAAVLDLSGSADFFDLELNGACIIDAKKFICKKSEVEINGAGVTELSVTDELFADIDGVGKLSYYGDPELINTSGVLSDVEQVSKEVYSD